MKHSERLFDDLDSGYAVSSRLIAEYFYIPHSKLVKIIDGMIANLQKMGVEPSDFFEKTKFKSTNNRWFPMYYITVEGTSLIFKDNAFKKYNFGIHAKILQIFHSRNWEFGLEHAMKCADEQRKVFELISNIQNSIASISQNTKQLLRVQENIRQLKEILGK